jgi:hypothetical protein
LDARVVPWVVIPDQAFHSLKIPPNAVSAVVCNSKIFYGIMGDTDADNPETIGEVPLRWGKRVSRVRISTVEMAILKSTSCVTHPSQKHLTQISFSGKTLGMLAKLK